MVNEVVTVVRQFHGLDLRPFDDTFLEKSLARRLLATSTASAVAYVERLAHDSEEAKALFDSLYIVYTDFFRSPTAFALLEQLILPRLLEAKQRSERDHIRVWSTGCASGQEAWSVAILLDELSRRQDQKLTYRIFATDLSAPSLDCARKGVYTAEAVNNLRLSQLREYFVPHGEHFAIAPRLRERVDFSVYDLLEQETTSPPTSIYGDFDLVFCSNVLLYYRPESRRVILDKIRGCLVPGGYLITDETERLIVGEFGGFYLLTPLAGIFMKS